MERVFRPRIGHALFVAAIAAVVLAGLAIAGVAVSPTGTNTPAAEQQYNKRITICHRSGKKKRSKYRTIRIPPRALRGHLRHGDGRGACSRAIFTICHKSKKGKKRTMKARGWKAHRKHMRHGDGYRACAKKKKKRR